MYLWQYISAVEMKISEQDELRYQQQQSDQMLAGMPSQELYS